MLARLAMLVAYDGTDYRGWTDVRDSVLRPTVAKVLRCDVARPPLIEAASRTDAGVMPLDRCARSHCLLRQMGKCWTLGR